ncbi:MAG: ISAs1 family transposase, partial [Propionibacteriaceae bacterium]|nr:ISAs1 family transposase [Propionibacteriaceae bacterium]
QQSPAAGWSSLLTARPSTAAHAAGARAPHLMAAFTHHNGVVLAQTQVPDRQNEIPAARRLLALMDLTGVVVTMDALHAQTTTAEQILGQHGDYLLTVKANQPSLYHALKHLPWPDVPSVSQVEVSHGRRTRRTTQAVMAPSLIDFPGARQVVKIRRTHTVKGKKTVEVVYLISSVPMDRAQPAVTGGLGPRALEYREPAPLGEGRHLRRGPPTTAHRHRPSSHGSPTQPGHQSSPPHRRHQHRPGHQTHHPQNPKNSQPTPHNTKHHNDDTLG